jgi:hypothetical protein
VKNPNSTESEITAIILCVVLAFGAMWFYGAHKATFASWYGWLKVAETYPYMFWNNTWAAAQAQVTGGGYDLSGSMPDIAKFFNTFAAPVWALAMGAFVLKAAKVKTPGSFRRRYTQQTLLETTVRSFSANAPWVRRDIMKESWNRGPWRLMESPSLFAIRRRCMRDPNGDPLKISLCFDCGETEEAYIDYLRDSRFFGGAYHSFDAFDPPRRQAREATSFAIPAPQVQSEEKELAKFTNGSLVPIEDSVYLNRKINLKLRVVENRLDEEKLRVILTRQLGGRLSGDDPFKCLLKASSWRHGLATALYLHGFSDKTKKTAFAIIDAMNLSFLNDKPMEKVAVDTSPAPRVRLEWRTDRTFTMQVMRHARFVNPFFMALLAYARGRGVVSTASFGWVRRLDRPLWYALSQTGRNVCCAEAAGAWSQFNAERLLDGVKDVQGATHAFDAPFLDIAIEGFRGELEGEGWLNAETERSRALSRRMQDESDAVLGSRARARGYST